MAVTVCRLTLVACLLLVLLSGEADAFGSHSLRNQKRLLRKWLAARQSDEEMLNAIASHPDHSVHVAHTTPAALPPTTESPASNEVTSTCSDDLFTCNNGECALLSWKCDGDEDCDDGSDELGCPPVTCEAGQFQCANRRCIPGQYQCDGGNDCGDGSDELDCQNFVRTCSPDQFQCASGRCISRNWVCDRDNDCGDYSDEQNCTHGTTPSAAGGPTCSSDQFQCANGRCINRNWVCDRDNDCGDLSDEQNCGGGSGTTSTPPRPPGGCPRDFMPLAPSVPGCFHPVSVSLRWQSAADYCRAINPEAHLVTLSESRFRDFARIMNDVPPFIASACPYWWTAGQRVDDTTINSPFVWRTFGRSCPAGGCLSQLNFPSSWVADAQGSGVPEGHPGCVLFSGTHAGIPWQLAPCETHACAICEV